jgi:hypothetical protein
VTAWKRILLSVSAVLNGLDALFAIPLAPACLALAIAACRSDGKCELERSSLCADYTLGNGSLEGERCESVAGCDWGMQCAPALCSTKTDSNTCGMYGHCSWNPDGGTCDDSGATPLACDYDAGVCEAVSGCVYSWRCTGVPTDCTEYENQGTCGADPHCNWYVPDNGFKVVP